MEWKREEQVGTDRERDAGQVEVEIRKARRLGSGKHLRREAEKVGYVRNEESGLR
jgi:hypothetical protein